MNAVRTEHPSAKSGVCLFAGRHAVGRWGFVAASVRAIRPSAVSALPVFLGRALHRRGSTALPSMTQGSSTKDRPSGFIVRAQRWCSSLALRGTAAPGRGGRVGTGFARAAGARMLGHQREGGALVVREGRVRLSARPNPSVERTANGGARCPAPEWSGAPLSSAHIKR